MFDFIRDSEDLRRQMEELRALPGEALAARRSPRIGLGGREFLPAVECFIQGGRLVLRAELPGVNPGDLELSVAGDQLILRGERRGRFERSFALPQGVKTDRIEARFENGVLEVTVHPGKVESARSIPIEIVETDRSSVEAA